MILGTKLGSVLLYILTSLPSLLGWHIGPKPHPTPTTTATPHIAALPQKAD